ncbi:hypothetical protein [Nostoc phage Nsp-JY10]
MYADYQLDFMDAWFEIITYFITPTLAVAVLVALALNWLKQRLTKR